MIKVWSIVFLLFNFNAAWSKVDEHPILHESIEESWSESSEILTPLPEPIKKQIISCYLNGIAENGSEYNDTIALTSSGEIYVFPNGEVITNLELEMAAYIEEHGDRAKSYDDNDEGMYNITDLLHGTIQYTVYVNEESQLLQELGIYKIFRGISAIEGPIYQALAFSQPNEEMSVIDMDFNELTEEFKINTMECQILPADMMVDKQR